MDRLTSTRASYLFATFLDADEEPAEVTGAVSVTVVDGNGDPVPSASGNATAVPNTPGVYRFPVDLTTLDSYVATFTGTVAGDTQTVQVPFDVVGGEVFTLAELRASNRNIGERPEDYPASRLRVVRLAAIERLEQAMNVAIVPKGDRANLSGDGTRLLLLPHIEVAEVYSVSVNGSPVSLSQVQVERWGGLLLAEGWPVGSGNVTVHYRHGFASTPAPVKQAAMILAASYATPSSLDPRATMMSTDAGAFRISTAGRDGHTGIPEVDAVIDEFGRQRPATGSAPPAQSLDLDRFSTSTLNVTSPYFGSDPDDPGTFVVGD